MAYADYQDNAYPNPWDTPWGQPGFGAPPPGQPIPTPFTQPAPPYTGTATPGPSKAADQNTGGGYSGPKDFTSIVHYWQSQHPASTPDMPGLIAFLNAQGIPVSTAMHNGMASDDKLLYNGQTYDLGTSLGGPGAAWFDQFGPQGADDGGGNAVGSAFNIDPSYLTPFNKQFVMPSDATLPQFRPAPAFSFPDFQSPTADDVLGDPGYQFRLEQGRKAIETSASARGLLNSGGNLSDILGFGQQLGSQEFGNVFDRKFNTWSANKTNAADAYRLNYGTQTVDPYQFDTTRANTTFQRAQDLFNTERDTFYKNQSNPFDKLYSLSNLGLNAASA